MIQSGQQFILSTESYTDGGLITVTALQDIAEQDFAVITGKFKAYNEISEWKTLSYDHIGAYLFLCGFVNEPEFLPKLGYSEQISKEDFSIDNRATSVWQEQVNAVKQAGII